MAHHELASRQSPYLYPVPAPVAGAEEPPEELSEYETLRAELSDTAAGLYEHGLPAANAFRAAYAIVGEDVADAALRDELHRFYLGPRAELTPVVNGLKLLSSSTTRAYVTLPPREEKQATVAFHEPVATYLARQALRQPTAQLADQLEPHAESNVGALFRAFIGRRRPPFTIPEAELAVSALSPLVATDLQQTLRIGHEDYLKRARR